MKRKKIGIDLSEVKYLVWGAFGILLLIVCTGCTIGETGSRTIVGSHFALPKFASTGGEVECQIYESTEGATVVTRKDSRVKVVYSNIYTNIYFGIMNKAGKMTLDVEVEPLAVDAPGDAKTDIK